MNETAQETTAEDAAPDAAKAAPGQVDRSTHFVFQHRVFTLEGARFTTSGRSREPVFHVAMGEVKGVIALDALRKEFSIPEESEDAKLLDIVAKSLRHVKEIRPFDSIPREILDGTASWSVTDEHRARAKDRLTIQLASWLTGDEQVIVDSGKLKALVEDPDTKRRVQEAVAQAAEKTGLGQERKQEVMDRIESFARELAYIEGLRDRCGSVLMIAQKIGHIANLYKRDRAILEEIVRVQTIIRQPAREFANIFQKIDARTGSILKVLEQLDEHVQFVRKMRDEIHFKLMDWDEIIEKWEAQKVERHNEVESLVRETYRFLAYRYPQTQNWKLVNR